MGKRKMRDKEDHIARKIRRLERKMYKVKRRRRRSSSSSNRTGSSDSSHSSERYWERSVTPLEDHDYQLDDVYMPESEKQEESPKEDDLPSKGTTTDPVPESGVVNSETDVTLNPDILNILGDEPEKKDSFGPEIHKDLSNRWSDILVNGLKDEVKKDILKCYDIPENLKLAQPPTLNPEIKAAVNENVLKRDTILLEKQKLLGCAITGIAKTITSILSSDKEVLKDNQDLKVLSHTGRLLCHIHYNETQSRRNFLLACLNKDVKDNIKTSKSDQMLFGVDLPDKLKSLKAISKTGAELKSVVSKGKIQPKNKQPEASTSRALNWRGPPPPPPPPRRGTARMNSTIGGRKQQPARRNQERQATRHRYGRTSHR